MKRLAIILALMASPAAAGDLQKFQSPDQRTKSRAESNAAAASLSAAQVSTIAEGGASYSGSAVSFTFNQAGGGGNAGGTTAIKTVPDVYAPALAGGNPCVVSVSAGAGWLGAGFSFGMGLQDEGCEVRQQAALLHNMGQADVALVHMCLHLPEVGETLKAMGGECTE